LRGKCVQGGLDFDELAGAEEVVPHEIEYAEPCIEKLHVSFVVLLAGFVRTVAPEEVFSDSVAFDYQPILLMAEVVDSDEVPSVVVCRDLREHPGDSEAEEFDRTDRFGG
jgi:hypothetical protein